MSTRKIVPNGDNEGGLGTADKRFASIYVTAPETGANDSRAVNAKWVQALVAQAKREALLDAHPVGSYYWSNDSTSPATLFGGTWEALPAGYTLIAQGSGSDDFGSFTYEAGKQYGERKHQLTTDEMPKHRHQIALAQSGFPDAEPQSILYIPGQFNNNLNGTFSDRLVGQEYEDGKKAYYYNSFFLQETGGSGAHSSIQPSICAYCWKRTA